MVHLDSGDLENAQRCIEEALKLSQKNNETWVEGASRTFFGRTTGKTDPARVDKAEESILQGISILEELKAKPLCSQGYFFLGELYAHAGQRSKALQNLKKAQRMFKEMGIDYWLAKAQGVLSQLF